MRRWLPLCLPAGILAGCGGWLAVHWASIPDRYPIHWDLRGQPNGWLDRSVGGVLAPIIVGALSVAVALASTPRRGDRDPTTGRASRTASLSVVAISTAIAVIFGAAALLPLATGPVTAVTVASTTLLALYLTLGLDGVLAWRRQRRSSRDDGWYGLFYYRRDDRNLLVPRANGLGVTLNIAHPAGMILCVAIALIPLVLLAWCLSELRGR